MQACLHASDWDAHTCHILYVNVVEHIYEYITFFAKFKMQQCQPGINKPWLINHGKPPPSIDNILQDSYRNCPAAICEPLQRDTWSMFLWKIAPCGGILQFIGNIYSAIDHDINVPISLISPQIYWNPNELRDSARLFAVSWSSDYYPYARGLLGRHLQEKHWHRF